MKQFRGQNVMIFANSVAFLFFMILYFSIGDADSDTWTSLYFIFQYMLPLALLTRLQKLEKNSMIPILQSLYFALILYEILYVLFAVEQTSFVIFVYFCFSLFLLSQPKIITKIWGQ